MRKYFREPILNRTIWLGVTYLVALLVIFLTYLYSTMLSLRYQAALINQLSHQELGNLIVTKLIDLESEFSQFASIDDARDLELAQEQMNSLFFEIQEILQVLQNGGVFVEDMSTNLTEMDVLEISIAYERSDEQGYFVEALDLTPRVLDVQDASAKLYEAVERKVTASTLEEELASAKEIDMLLKQADTFFTRSRESANRIYFDSRREMDRISRERIRALRRAGSVSLVVGLLVFAATGILTRHELRQIRALLKERDDVEHELRETELRYRTVADFTYGWEYWRGPDGNLEYVSPSSEQITGYTAEEFIEMPGILDAMIYADDMHIWEKHGSETNEELSRQEIRFRIRRKDGEVIWIEHACQPVITSTGEFVGYRASNRDITRRLETQTALRESEELYRSLFENSPVGIVLADEDGNILSINSTALRMLGSPSKEASQAINLLTFPPLVASGFVKDFYTCLETNKTIQNSTEYISKWGAHLNSRYALTAIRQPDGTLFGVQILLEDITEQVRDKADLQRQILNFATINTINNAILTRTDLESMVGIVLVEITERLNIDAADLLVYDENALTLTCTAQQGFHTIPSATPTVLRVGDGFAGQAAVQRKTVRLRDLNDPNLHLEVPGRWRAENFTTYYGVPLLVKGELKGILELFQREAVTHDKAWLDFMETLAQQVAIAIDSHFLLDALQRSNMELELAYETTLEGWARALEMRDYETKGHTERVAALTVDLARALGVPSEELTHIRRGALLHDIGKIAVSDTILLKEGPCTEEEWEIIRKHPYYGYEMLQKITYLKPSLDIVLYHHERWNGSGYPEGLAGERIPYSARIFAIVDVWDALTSNRPYHDAWNREETLAYIRSESGEHFDPQVVDAFLSLIHKS